MNPKMFDIIHISHPGFLDIFYVISSICLVIIALYVVYSVLIISNNWKKICKSPKLDILKKQKGKTKFNIFFNSNLHWVGEYIYHINYSIESVKDCVIYSIKKDKLKRNIIRSLKIHRIIIYLVFIPILLMIYTIITQQSGIQYPDSESYKYLRDIIYIFFPFCTPILVSFLYSLGFVILLKLVSKKFESWILNKLSKIELDHFLRVVK